MKADKSNCEKPADKPLMETPLSRRGLFAALAVAAGLGLLGANDALGWDYWGQNARINQGAWDMYGMINGKINCCKGRSNPVNQCMGWANDWTEWYAFRYAYVQILRYALNFQVECDYENELWFHLSFYPLTACGDTNYNPNGKRIWFKEHHDNLGAIKEDDQENNIVTFDGNLTNEELRVGTGRHDTGWKHYQYHDTGKWYRRTSKDVSHRWCADLNIFNIHVEGVLHGETVDALHSQTGWLTSTVEQTYLTSEDIQGIVCRVRAADDDSLNWDVGNASIKDCTDLFQQIFKGNYNQLFLTEFSKVRDDSYHDDWGPVPGFLTTFRPAHVADASCAVNALGGGPWDGKEFNHVANKQPFEIHRAGVASRASAWWVTKAFSEGTPLFEDGAVAIISDASGLCVNRPNATQTRPFKLNLFHNGYKGGVAGDRASAWVVEEVPFTGSLSLNAGSKEIGAAQTVTCSDPLLSCTPCHNWSDVKGNNGGTAVSDFMYRWYYADTDDVPLDCSGASIIGSCHLSNFGDMPDCPAYRHVGMNMSAKMCIEAISLRLDGSPWQGSICYSMLAKGGEWSDAAADGARIGEGGKSLRWSAIKVWLTGEVSQHFDLEVRAFNSNLSWTGGYVSGHDLDFASVNGFGDLKGVNELRCVQVDLITKPKGAKVLREFSKGSTELSLTERELDSLSGRYLSCVVQQVFPTELRSGINFDSPLVHRFHGSVSAGPVHVGGIKVIYHADGIDDESVVFTETAQPGPHTASADATSAAIKTHCNLNEHFDEDPSTGFTGWFTDKGLTAPYGGSELSTGDELHLYGRNRCTVRIDYAEGSLRPEEGMLFREGASDSAPVVAGALDLVDFARSAETHALDGLTLPAIGDDGIGHKAVYWGERVAPTKPRSVYSKRSDGTWRRYVAECWLTSAGGVPRRSPSRRNGTQLSMSSGPWRNQTASRAQRGKYHSGRGCGLRPESACVPYGRCA